MVSTEFSNHYINYIINWTVLGGWYGVPHIEEHHFYGKFYVHNLWSDISRKGLLWEWVSADCYRVPFLKEIKLKSKTIVKCWGMQVVHPTVVGQCDSWYNREWCLVLEWSRFVNPGSTIVTELTLKISKTDPVEEHVLEFGEFGGDGIVCNPSNGKVVNLKGWTWLGPAHFDEILAERENLLCVDKEGRKFRVGCEGHDEFDDLNKSEEWSVVWWYCYIFREKYGGPFPAAVFDFIKEGHVRVPCGDHTSDTVYDSIIWLPDNVVQ